ncbi:exportin-7 isoform X3 [Eucalyptus grandis]|uniref:exportin-7 isoform X3 n=1 Tax=Eucalyptus grandis TaxID=71139 RepID=UPI00192EB112|nr:exportin-7 isoform X3 [Eucalyptus grandis]
MESLAQLEALCERLYNSQDSAERAHAENTLKCFSVNTDYISQCQYILDNALTPYALMLASSSLLKQVTEHTLALQLRLDIRNYLINYLATRGPKLQPFVTASLIQLLCRITKFGWFDDDRFRDVVKEATDFLSQATSDHYAIGLKILNQLVSEMNQSNVGLPSTHHRRVACSFRDQSLSQIFQISLTSLHQLKNDASRLQELALSLTLKCLSFDFVGTSIDESSEEFGTVQIPSSWRMVLEDPSTLQIFFDYYAIGNAPLSKEALECLVRLASVRRSLFTNDAARSKFLAHLMTGTKEILQTGQGLADHDNYHEFCRLLGRFRVNYQLSELVNVEGYGDWIRLVAAFTLKSLQSWQWASSSVYYLLGLWSRLVTSVPYLKGDAPSLLEEFVPKITEGFITSRFDSIQAGFPDDPSENPLDNVELLQDQLDCFPYLCRFQYESSSLYIIQMMEPILQTYTERARLSGGDSSDLSIIEAKLAWIVHIIAAIVKMKQCIGCSMESQEVLDAELSARVLQLINVTDTGLHSQRYGELSKQRLDRALLTFFQHFRKSYVGDQAMHSSKQLYARLSELLGIHDHLLLLNVIMSKIATNLKCYTESEEVIDHTLSLFLELASGYMTGKLLLKLDSVKFIIANHTREHFPFLEEYRCSRSRTTFYYIIGWLIFLEDSPLKFKSSMEPLLQVFISLESTPDSMFRTDAVKYALIGLMRDLRGIAMATNSRRTYGLLFDWLYPAHMPLLLKGISHWSDTPEVTTPMLKFMAEFVLNKAQRLTFDSSSPNGILLFREVSKLIVAYGSRILSLPNAADIYAFKYKGIWISFTILSRALAGNYVNFGVFELYGDRALSDALDIALKMTLSIPLADILAYRKLTRAYFAFLEVLFSSHIVFILNLDASTFMHIVGSLESGLKGLDTNISSQCASAVDNLAAFYFNNITMGEAPNSAAAINLARHIADCPTLFPEILKTLFEIVLFEDCGNQWSLSRPMLSLILISEQIFSDLKAQILASQLVDQHQRLSLCFDKLMADVTRSLDSKNRDKFTQNLTVFRHEFRVK